MLRQKPAAIIRVKHACESPRLVLERLHVLDLDEQHVSLLGGLDLKRARQVVHAGQVDVSHVVGAVVVLDLPAGPVGAFDLDDFAVLDAGGGRDCEGVSLRMLAADR